MFKLFLILQLIALALASFEQDCLAAHNKYRAQHSAGPLRLDSNLQNVAQNYANYLAANNKFEHSGNGYGENLYAVWGTSSVAASSAVKAWYDEIKDYDFNNPGFSGATGHFTQVVWKGSQRVGCAAAVNGKTVVVVATYDPPGNYLGQFPKNVSKN